MQLVQHIVEEAAQTVLHQINITHPSGPYHGDLEEASRVIQVLCNK